MYPQKRQSTIPVIKRPTSRNLEPIKSSRQEDRREQLRDRKYVQPETGTNTKCDKVISLIREHLLAHGYARTFETLKKESSLINRTPQNVPSIGAKYGSSGGKADDLKIAIRYFEKGQRDEFFKQAFKFLEAGSDQVKKLEFELQVYFCIYSVHVMGKRQQVIEKQAVESFKKFLEAHGSAMATNVEYIHFFSLPHNPKPQETTIFATIFSKEWVYRLKTKTNELLRKAIAESGGNNSKENEKKSELDEIYEKYTNGTETEKKKEQKELEQAKRQTEELLKKISEVENHNEYLLKYVNQLTFNMEAIAESSKSNLIESNKKWFIFVKDILNTVRKGSKSVKIEGMDKYYGFFGKNVEEILNNADVSIFDKASMIMDDLSMNKSNNMINKSSNQYKKNEASSQIDMAKIKALFANAGLPEKETEICILLRTLKNRFSKIKNPYTKREIVVEYTRHDLCGVTPQSSYIMKQLLVEGSERIREFYLRLMNEICSDIFGIQYLTKSDTLVENLITILKQEKGSNKDYVRFILGILQKFSYPKKSRSLMISLGIIPLIFKIFDSEKENMSDYTIQYLMAMIMNLSLTKHSEKDFSLYRAELLEIFIGLLDIDNDKIKNYVNGSLFLLLNFKEIMHEATKQNLEANIVEVLDRYRQEEQEEDNFHIQYEYILKKLRGQIEIDSDEEDSESEGEEAIGLDEFEEDDDLEDDEDNDYDSNNSSEYIEGEDDFVSGDELLMREFTLLGPEALKEQLLTRSVLDETSKRVDNLTLSVNHSKRMDNIFSSKDGKDRVSQQLQPELDKLLRQEQQEAISPTLKPGRLTKKNSTSIR